MSSEQTDLEQIPSRLQNIANDLDRIANLLENLPDTQEIDFDKREFTTEDWDPPDPPVPPPNRPIQCGPWPGEVVKVGGRFSGTLASDIAATLRVLKAITERLITEGFST